MKIGTRDIAPDRPPYIIAEIGVNHDGSVDRALDLVAAAKHAGADAIKLQLFETDRLLSREAKFAAYQVQSGDADPFAMLRRLELNVTQMSPIVAAAHESDLHAIVTVFTAELVRQAEKLHWDAYKTASPDIINRPLIDALAATGRPLLVSAGASTLDEIKQAAGWLSHRPHLFMHCVSAYPTPDESASLRGLAAMRAAGVRALGYSDHTASIDGGALAVASGACVLEKHLTYDRAASGPDHAASLDPPMFAEYVRLAHRAFRMLGELNKLVLPIEQEVRKLSRQSLTSTRDLPAGHVIAPADLTIKRPGTGLSPAVMQATVGRRVRRPIAADTPLREEDLA